MTNTLYMMIGLPGSGKSHWLGQHLPHACVLSPDRWLGEAEGYVWTPASAAQAWATCYRELGRILSEGTIRSQTYVWDSTSPTPRDRSAVLNITLGAGWRVVAVYLDTDLVTCVRRNNARPPNRRVPDDRMVYMVSVLTPPQGWDGYHEVVRVRRDGP